MGGDRRVRQLLHDGFDAARNPVPGEVNAQVQCERCLKWRWFVVRVCGTLRARCLACGHNIPLVEGSGRVNVTG